MCSRWEAWNCLGRPLQYVCYQCKAQKRLFSNKYLPRTVPSLGGLPDQFIVHHILLLIGIVLDEEVPCDLRRVLSRVALSALVSGFNEKNGIIRSGEVGGQWAASRSAPNDNVVILILGRDRIREERDCEEEKETLSEETHRGGVWEASSNRKPVFLGRYQEAQQNYKSQESCHR